MPGSLSDDALNKLRGAEVTQEQFNLNLVSTVFLFLEFINRFIYFHFLFKLSVCTLAGIVSSHTYSEGWPPFWPSVKSSFREFWLIERQSRTERAAFTKVIICNLGELIKRKIKKINNSFARLSSYSLMKLYLSIYLSFYCFTSLLHCLCVLVSSENIFCPSYQQRIMHRLSNSLNNWF